MSELERLLGPENLKRLAEAVGGAHLSIPKHFGKPPTGGRDTSVRLISLVGESLAVLLVFHFGDSRIYVPRLKPAEPVDRNRLRRLDREGMSAPEIARALQCSTRTVEKHRARSRARISGSKREERRA
jgi:hypothetical protein